MNDPVSQLAEEYYREIATTRRMLARVPEDHFDWKPHPKSMTLGVLATHISELLLWQTFTLEKDEYDIAGPRPPRVVPGTTEELLRTYDGYLEKLRASFARTSPADLDLPWTLRNGDSLIFTEPKALVVRTHGIGHMAHHRGQLSVYLRLLNVPVPPSYGPTADEM